MKLPSILAVIGLVLFNVVSSAAAPSPPSTPKRPVTDAYHGVKVVDEFRWLEDAEKPEVQGWTKQQNAYTRSILDAVPGRAAIHQRLEQLYHAESPSYSALEVRGGRLFALKRQPPLQQSLLVTLASADDVQSEQVVLDPNKLNSEGTTSINLFAPSPDGRLVAVSLTEGGSEEGTLYLYETATGRRLPDRIPRVVYATGGGSVAWKPEGRGQRSEVRDQRSEERAQGFYYTRYPRAGERPPKDLNFYEQVYWHKVGTPEKDDTYVIGREFPRIAEVFLEVSPDGRHLLVTVQNGDGGDFAHYLQDASGKWTQLTQFTDGVKAITFGPRDDLYLFSKQGAPRGAILRLPLKDAGRQRGQMVVPESEAVIEGFDWRGMSIVPNFVVASNVLYVIDLVGGPSQVRVFDLAGRLQSRVPILPVSAAGPVVRLGGDDILFQNGSYLEPAAWYRFQPASGRVVRTALFQASPVSFHDTEVVREFAVSKDGTKVPLNIVRRKGAALDGNNPTLLTGYGGYGVSLTPGFLGIRTRLWLDRGGIVAVANLRGGGEFGEEWHKGGNLTKKQNVFDDFAACAQFLVDAKYTRPNRLAIEGGSNGGLLMGAALTQHPRLFRAVVSHVGIYDMLRVELEPNGAFNVPEFGSVKDPEQFRALHAYSPYHRVTERTPYPAVLLVTGENDKRVNPANSRKMTARLQAATGSDRPILLRTSSSAGHGAGTALSERIAEQADVLAFLFDQLGMR